MSYTDGQVSAATAAMDKYRGCDDGEVGSALVVVGLSAERTAKEAQIRDDMIRVAHRAGAPIRQLGEVSGLVRKTVTAIVSSARGTDCPAPAGLSTSGTPRESPPPVVAGSLVPGPPRCCDDRVTSRRVVPKSCGR